MRPIDSIRKLVLATTSALYLWTHGSTCYADMITLASTSLGPTDQVGGTGFQPNEYVGWRFTTSVPLAVEQVGGHMYASSAPPSEIVAALVRVASLTSTPVGAPFTESELIAKTTFLPGFPSDDFLTPLSATLIPGSYMLVFGTGFYDTTGGAGFPNPPEQTYIAPTTKDSYLLWGAPNSGESPRWREGQLEHLRFIVQGQETTFPADFEGDGDVDSDDLAIWNGAYGKNALGDADGDGDSDGRDFLDWQRQYTGAAEAVSSEMIHLEGTTFVPEPGTLALLFALAMGVAIIRAHKS